MTIGKQSFHFMGVYVNGLTNGDLPPNERTQCGERLIMCTLEMNDM